MGLVPDNSCSSGSPCCDLNVLWYFMHQERTNAVMAHPAFKSNPIAAIMRHLEATVSATEEASKQSKTTRRRRNKNKGSAHGAAKGDSKGDDME